MVDKNPESLLVVVDGSEEMEAALHFACCHAVHTQAMITLLYVQETPEFHHWLGVQNIARHEERETGEKILDQAAEKVFTLTGMRPALDVREGSLIDAFFQLLEADSSINHVILAASQNSNSPGPIISYALSKGLKRLHVPITIVPGNLSCSDIEKIA